MIVLFFRSAASDWGGLHGPKIKNCMLSSGKATGKGKGKGGSVHIEPGALNVPVVCAIGFCVVAVIVVLALIPL